MDIKQSLEHIAGLADWVSITEIREETTTRIARNGRPEVNNNLLDHGFMVEVLVDGQFGYAATSTHGLSALKETAQRAVALACKSNKYKVHNFDQSVRPKSLGTYATPYHKSFKEISVGDLSDFLVKMTKYAHVSDKIINTTAKALLIERDSRMVSSNGSDIHQKTFMVSLDIAATAQEGVETQTRSLGMPFWQRGAEVFEIEKGRENAERVGREALELLKAEECPSGMYDLVLAPDQLYLQIHESIGHPLELDRILGDERNYAGWSFIKPSDFGILQYGSSILNVTFDPFIEGEAASYAFDDTGNKATREHLIKDGKLLRGLGSLESQERLNLPGVANARMCSWNRPPIDRMANINLEPGSTSFEEMISQIENGIFMSTNRSWSIDDYRNKFQFGCEFARRIENGRLTKVLKNPNYRGVTVPFWNSLKGVGDRQSMEIWGSPYCGKGEPNQVIRVGHATPPCWFSNIEVFGGA